MSYTLLLIMEVAPCGIDIQHVFLLLHYEETGDVEVMFPWRLHTG
jgi:hypothetical protein